MSFGEASNGFFWLGYYGDTSDWWEVNFND